MADRGKGKGKKRVKGGEYYSLLMIFGIIALLGVISFFLFRGAFEEKPSAPPPPIAKEEKKPAPPVSRLAGADLLDRALGERLSSMGVEASAVSRTEEAREIGGVRWTYAKEEISLPSAITLEDAKRGVEDAVESAGGEIISAKKQAGSLEVKLGIDAVLTHELIFRRKIEPVGKAVLAIVIDDMGGRLDTARTIAAIDPKITFAVMPHQAQSEAVARAMAKSGHDVILHQPMEPTDLARHNPGKGALLLSMSPGEINRIIDENLRLVPGVKGVNNHMGSRFTEDADAVAVVAGELKKRGLFFLDSRTTPRSKVIGAAKAAGVRNAARDVFLDNDVSEEHTRQQLKKAAELAKKTGRAIAIGHPHPSTIKVLQEMVPRLREQGIEIVGVSKLVG